MVAIKERIKSVESTSVQGPLTSRKAGVSDWLTCNKLLNNFIFKVVSSPLEVQNPLVLRISFVRLLAELSVTKLSESEIASLFFLKFMKINIITYSSTT